MSDSTAWQLLGISMRRLRQASGESLRQLESTGGWARGTLSRVENGKARPSLALVQFYDVRFGGDGLLISLYADAHTVRPEVGPIATARAEHRIAGDRMEVLAASPPHGVVLTPGHEFQVRWTLRNSGTVPWHGRALTRVGATAGVRLVSSRPCTPLADTAPGAVVDVDCSAVAPREPGTVVAQWAMINAGGSYCFPVNGSLAVTIVVAR